MEKVNNNKYVAVSVTDMITENNMFEAYLLGYEDDRYNNIIKLHSNDKTNLFKQITSAINSFYKNSLIITSYNSIGFLAYTRTHNPELLDLFYKQKPNRTTYSFGKKIGVSINANNVKTSISNIDYKKIEDIEPLKMDLILRLKEDGNTHSYNVTNYIMIETVLRNRKMSLKEIKEFIKNNGFNKDTFYKLKEDMIEQTLYHEVIRSILDTMGEYELNKNEKFVHGFSVLLHQFEKTKK